MPLFLTVYPLTVLLMVAAAPGGFHQDLEESVPSEGCAKAPIQNRANSGSVRVTVDGVVDESLQAKTLPTGKESPSDSVLVGLPLMTLKHFAAVRIAVFSPDGKYIASVGSSPENWIRIWDAATGKLVRVLKGHTFDVATLVFSPNGKQIATAGHDETMRIWDVETGKQVCQLEDQGVRVSLSLTFSPNGRFVIGGSTSGVESFRAWDPSTGREIRRIPVDRSYTSSLAQSPNGKWIACVDGPNTIGLFDVEAKEPPKVLKGHKGFIQRVVYSPDGKLIASCGGGAIAPMNRTDGEVKLWDANTGREIRDLARHSNSFLDLAFSPDGERLVAVSHDHLLKVWDVATGKELMSFRDHGIIPRHRRETRSVAFSPDGQRIISCGSDKYVRVWDATRVELVPVTDPTPPLARSDSVVVIDQKPTRYLRDVECVAFSPDGKRVVSGASDGEVKLWDTISGQELFTLRSHQLGLYYIKINQVAFSPDGKLIVSCGDDGKVRLWKADSGEPVKTIERQPGIKFGEPPILNVAFSPDGTRIFSGTGSAPSVFRVLETASGTELFGRKYEASELNNDVARFFAFSPDGKQFLIACPFKTILFDAGAGKPIRELDGILSDGTKAVFSPDGRRVVSTSSQEIAVVDTETGKQLTKVRSPINTGVRSCPVFSPDGKTFATGGFAGSVSLWDVATGKEIQRNFDETGPISALAYSPDGKFLVSGSARLPSLHEIGATVRDGEVQLWDAATGEMLRTFVPQSPREVPEAEQDAPAVPAAGPVRINIQLARKRDVVERDARAQVAKADWKAAAQGYARMFELQPLDNGELGFEAAAVLLLAGDEEGYRQKCADLLEKSGTAAIRSYHAARACTLAPDSVKDFAIPAQKAANELRSSHEFWSLTQQGALACRAGRYDEAAERLEVSLQADFRSGTVVLNWLWLALVEHHRGKPMEARAWLEKVTNWMDKVSLEGSKMPANVDGLHLHNWLEALILRREVEALLAK